VIEAHRLVKRFKKVVAVDKLSFTVHDGEVFGLLGPNGAGKTTTLRLLATVLEPNAGTATVNGYDIRTHKDQVRATVGLLVEDAGLYRKITAREHLRYFGRLHALVGRRQWENERGELFMQPSFAAARNTQNRPRKRGRWQRCPTQADSYHQRAESAAWQQGQWRHIRTGSERLPAWPPILPHFWRTR
jgi:ABC-type Na+ transport system ATPase subunit NatA